MKSTDSVTIMGAMAFGDWPPDEDYEERMEVDGRLDSFHPEACWYTIHATPEEQMTHYREQSPPCEFFKCEGFNALGYWYDCVGKPGPHHTHMV